MKTTRAIIRIVLLALMAGLAGCSWVSQQFVSKDDGPNIVKASVRVGVNGDVDGAWENVDYASTSPFASLSQHSFCQEGGDYDPVVSKDGKMLAFCSMRRTPNPDIYIKAVSGRTATRLTSDPASEIQPCFSPDGTKVAYAANRSGNWDIWIVDVNGRNPMQVTDDVSSDIHPSFSPDGKFMVYSSLSPRTNQWGLWIVSVDNPSLKRWIGYGLYPEWNPNPKINKIAYQLPRYRGSQWFSIWTVDIVDGEALHPTEIATAPNSACITPSWSPDGKKIAYCSVSSAIYEKEAMEKNKNNINAAGEDIWVIDLDGYNNVRLTGTDASDFSPTWSPDGRVFFCSDRKTIDNVWSIKPQGVDFNVTEPVEISTAAAGLSAN
ncbi:MAG: PD40 domain-containing protein [Phycisphaerae bacterium]|nr:PD40 domain-containing protein [Phycisphaerae bacterium]